MERVYRGETKEEKRKRYQRMFIESEKRNHLKQKLQDQVELERSGKALAAWRNQKAND